MKIIKIKRKKLMKKKEKKKINLLNIKFNVLFY